MNCKENRFFLLKPFLFILYFSFSIHGYLHGQINNPIEITNTADGSYMVKTADLDGDGDLDILWAAFDGGKISWQENIDNTNTFGPEQIISADIPQATSLFPVDMDDDGDIDILSSSRCGFCANIFLHTNDGLGNFTTTPIESDNLEAWQARYVEAVDLDNDNDFDILVGSRHGITWFENTGNNTFSSEIDIVSSIGGSNITGASITTADFDNDGDMDVLAANALFTVNPLLYISNNGNSTFTLPDVISSGPSTNKEWVSFGDLDNDGDLDLLSVGAAGTEGADALLWHSNLINGVFSAPLFISSYNADRIKSLKTVDMDNDGDLDLLVGFFLSEVGWFENDFNNNGNLVDATYHLISSSILDRVRYVEAVDIDNDNDIDVLVSSYSDDEVNLFLNPTILTVDEPSVVNVLCTGENTGSISYNNLTGIAPIQFEWSNGGGLFSNNNLSDGMYTVTITAADGQSLIDTIEITSSSPPLTINLNSITDIYDAPGTIDITPEGGVPPYTFNWYDELNNLVSTEVYLETFDPGTYHVEVVDENGCTTVLENLTIQIIISTEDVPHKEYWNIYPNPTTNKLTITGFTSKEFNIEIFDSRGNVIWQGIYHKQIDFTDFPKGMYIVKIQAGDFIAFKKLIKI